MKSVPNAFKHTAGTSFEVAIFTVQPTVLALSSTFKRITDYTDALGRWAAPLYSSTDLKYSTELNSIATSCRSYILNACTAPATA